MTAPSATMASRPPGGASRWATMGISKAPGTPAMVPDDVGTPPSWSPLSTPSSSRSVIAPLNLAHTIATCGARRVETSVSPEYDTPTRDAVSSTAPGRNSATSEDVIKSLQKVSQALLLGAQVLDVLRVGVRVETHPIDDVEAEALKTAVFGGVVGHEAHLGHAEVDEDLRADAVLAAVDRQPELEVGVHGVVALLLQVVCAQLVRQPDAAPFVPPEVDHHAGALGADEAHRLVQLGPAITAQRAEYVSRQAFG